VLQVDAPLHHYVDRPWAGPAPVVDGQLDPVESGRDAVQGGTHLRRGDGLPEQVADDREPLVVG